MDRENRPDSMNKRHRALLLLYLRLSAFGRIIVAGLGKRAIQFMLAFILFMFSGNAMANNREHQPIVLAGMTWMACLHPQG
ncbi:hypothetical protein SL267_33620 [Serratia marcescens]|uniref:hypothetical protein n=1 Tax=Serratia sp. JKS000199 TaxID=1938820 RepID=UPI000BB7FE0D|nr:MULTISPECIES: hypothetical protein [Serratia]MBH3080533.1 hypothetical protein [Serratia sp. JKS000199]MBH3184622.1 hypothetical protein [Serratia sp. JKS000199]BCZ58745.1 hypothetical protein SL267_33620 [Serratia marcescens]SNY84757.1 hypothetical protein SAMN06272785_2812 [Serratia sp. JKS000199]